MKFFKRKPKKPPEASKGRIIRQTPPEGTAFVIMGVPATKEQQDKKKDR